MTISKDKIKKIKAWIKTRKNKKTNPKKKRKLKYA